jgi:hypothetical protein
LDGFIGIIYEQCGYKFIAGVNGISFITRINDEEPNMYRYFTDANVEPPIAVAVRFRIAATED